MAGSTIVEMRSVDISPSVPYLSDEWNMNWLVVPKTHISVPVLIKGRAKHTIREFTHYCLRQINLGPSITRWYFTDDLGTPISIERIQEHRDSLRQLNVHRTFGIALQVCYWSPSEGGFTVRRNNP